MGKKNLLNFYFFSKLIVKLSLKCLIILLTLIFEIAILKTKRQSGLPIQPIL